MDYDRYNLLIDGYNLMHVAGFVPRRAGPGQFKQQRERFLRWLLKRLPADQLARTIVLFDGRETTHRHVSYSEYHGLMLQFSPAGVEADDLIEGLIARHSAPKQLRVISSDHRLHRAARQRRAYCMDSEEFFDNCQTQKGPSAPTRQLHRKPQDTTDEELSAEELDEWMRVFDDVDPGADHSPKRNFDRESTPPGQPGEPVIRVPPVVPVNEASSLKADRLSTPQGDVESIKELAEAEMVSPIDAAESAERSEQSESVEFWEERLRDLLEE